ncbi:MAG: transposase [Stagnimonas sp.]|nr:transposase [Stagnimonas sp.]
MPNYIRASVPGGTFFFTVALAERSQSLLTEHADLLRLAFREERQAHPFTVDAIVVLPEHLHCLWTLPPDDGDFSSRWRRIKAGFSSRLARGERRSASRGDKGEAASGNGGSGSIACATSGISRRMWATSTSTRSSMGW